MTAGRPRRNTGTHGCAIGDASNGLNGCGDHAGQGGGGHAQLRHDASGDGGAGHGHEHGHHHQHGPFGHDHHRHAGRRGLKIVLFLVGTFMVVEFVGGWLANSLALMADAAHMLTDVVAIGLALFALWFSRRPAPPEKTYGYLRLEILAALLNGVVLIVISAGVLFEAYRRLRSPAEVETGIMLGVASIGLVVNIAAALILHRSAGHNLNVRGAYIHILGDMLGTVGVITAALVIRYTGWLAADPLTSVIVALLILFSSYKLVRESVDVLLEAVPPHLDMAEIREAIDDIPGVDDVHDLHVWTVTSGFFAMSGHAVVERADDHQRVLEEIHRRMRERFGIRHVTFQLEREAMYVQEEHL